MIFKIQIPTDKIEFDYPPKPYLHAFISASILREMVREAIKNYENWHLMISGVIRFVDLPIFKSLKIET